MNQYASLGKGHFIHSLAQLEYHGNTVDDKALANDGLQRMITSNGYVIPFAIRDALVYMDMRPPTDIELNEGPNQLPQLILTSDNKWTPSSIDSEPDYDTYFDTIDDPSSSHSNGCSS